MSLIDSAAKLITSHHATVDGFLAQSLAKTGKAAAFVVTAKEFLKALKEAETIKVLDKSEDDPEKQSNQIESVVTDLLANLDCRRGLISAAGLSQKARQHLTDAEVNLAVKRVLRTLSIDSADEFITEVFYRYLLSEGDALGGQMRNYIGAEAGYKLTNALIDALAATRPNTSDPNTPAGPPHITKSESQKIIRVAWDERLLLFDVKPALIGKNIDVILLDTSRIPAPTGRATKRTPTGEPSDAARKEYERRLLAVPECYIACGELKGGIDPAGADEHWKTARSALQRIDKRFTEGHRPALFFVGAAIQADMAAEIFSYLEGHFLARAANLTVPEQVADLAKWLISL